MGDWWIQRTKLEYGVVESHLPSGSKDSSEGKNRVQPKLIWTIKYYLCSGSRTGGRGSDLSFAVQSTWGAHRESVIACVQCTVAVRNFFFCNPTKVLGLKWVSTFTETYSFAKVAEMLVPTSLCDLALAEGGLFGPRATLGDPGRGKRRHGKNRVYPRHTEN